MWTDDTGAWSRPSDFPRNDWVVEAFQSAWSAITLAGGDLALRTAAAA